jgi:hypothetical protein
MGEDALASVSRIYYDSAGAGWGINASLATSRDRLMGILFGLIVMWLVYDAYLFPTTLPRLWGGRADV